mmetsp:Transcript_36227/g.104392  ORF Transcript_36227/g.104392 Transcript_36227/m.104392 type:complete len:347 (-) Transcript_36227:2763-3803(-)
MCGNVPKSAHFPVAAVTLAPRAPLLPRAIHGLALVAFLYHALACLRQCVAAWPTAVGRRPDNLSRPDTLPDATRRVAGAPLGPIAELAVHGLMLRLLASIRMAVARKACPNRKKERLAKRADAHLKCQLDLRDTFVIQRDGLGFLCLRGIHRVHRVVIIGAIPCRLEPRQIRQLRLHLDARVSAHAVIHEAPGVHALSGHPSQARVEVEHLHCQLLGNCWLPGLGVFEPQREPHTRSRGDVDGAEFLAVCPIGLQITAGIRVLRNDGQIHGLPIHLRNAQVPKQSGFRAGEAHVAEARHIEVHGRLQPIPDTGHDLARLGMLERAFAEGAVSSAVGLDLAVPPLQT